MKIFRMILLTIIVGVPLALGYFGIIPRIAKVLGTDKPRDLGKEFSQEVYDASYDRAGCEKLTMQVGESENYVKYSDFHDVNMEFNDDEITSLANQKNFQNSPVTDVQVRFNDDGTAEGSGMVSTPNLVNYLIQMGVPADDIAQAMEKYPVPKNYMPFYVSGKASVTNNNIDLNVSKLELGRIPVPSGIVNTYQGALADFIEGTINTLAPEANIESASIENGKLHYIGNLPGKEYTLKH